MIFSQKVSTTKSPCLKCKNRQESCHMKCDKYNKYKEANLKLAKIQKEKR